MRQRPNSAYFFAEFGLCRQSPFKNTAEKYSSTMPFKLSQYSLTIQSWDNTAKPRKAGAIQLDHAKLGLYSLTMHIKFRPLNLPREVATQDEQCILISNLKLPRRTSRARQTHRAMIHEKFSHRKNIVHCTRIDRQAIAAPRGLQSWPQQFGCDEI